MYERRVISIMKKTCKVCGKILRSQNKSGCCKEHYDQSGANNPCFGKKYTEEERERFRQTTAKLWEDPAYREKVIKAVSKPRREGFKEEQSKRVKKWYKKNPEQKELRSIRMSKSWAEGNITVNAPGFSYNTSKAEQQLFEGINKEFEVTRSTVHIKGKWYMPDVISTKDGVIIELFGDYWHANPNRYKADDIVRRDITAQEIWDKDNKRKEELEEAGYQVYIVWESEFKKDPDFVIKSFADYLNWESCAF